MLFNSLQFAYFFILVFALYYGLSHRMQNRFLLIASYVFYGAWDYRFLTLILASTVLDYFCGQKIHSSRKKSKRKFFLICSMAGNLSILGFFKYFNFFADSLQDLLAVFNLSISTPILTIALPVGISFYTFQTMSYTIDIYRRKLKPTKEPLDFALFVAFFPQLVAGPIERAVHLLPQILKPRPKDWAMFTEGCRLALWGLFKKMVVADRLAIYVDAVYNNTYQHSSLTFLLATIFFAFQIYCDFSGYSDIARGISKMLGFDLMVNFRAPYFAKNLREFWRRWHISLSTWLRDYLYISLGGNRGGSLLTYRNLILTMLLGGLWHGASWNFVIWGAIHGVFLVINRYRNASDKGDSLFVSGVKVLSTFTIVLAAWVFFRAETFGQAIYILQSVFSPQIVLFMEEGVLRHVVNGLMGITVVILIDYLAERRNTDDVLLFKSKVVTWVVSYALLFGIILFGVAQGEQFIYFQF